MKYSSLILLLSGIGAGLCGGWFLWHPAPAVIETPAPAVVQSDGSLILERKPELKPEPPHHIPAGGKVERVVTVTVRPKVSGSPAPAQPIEDSVKPAGGPGLPVPDVHVDMSLIRLPDGSRRVVASSPDGDVVGGVDIPATEEAAKQSRVLKWAAGGYYSPTGSGYGGWLERDFGPFRVGADVGTIKEQQRYGLDARARIGIRF